MNLLKIFEGVNYILKLILTRIFFPLQHKPCFNFNYLAHVCHSYMYNVEASYEFKSVTISLKSNFPDKLRLQLNGIEKFL